MIEYRFIFLSLRIGIRFGLIVQCNNYNLKKPENLNYLVGKVKAKFA